MRVAVYPGSFNPWHEGHTDILKKALKSFDLVVVAKGLNPEKESSIVETSNICDSIKKNLTSEEFQRVNISAFTGLLSEFVNKWEYVQYEPGYNCFEVSAVIRGLRDFQDFENEKKQQYHYEDLGLKAPVMYIISDRKLVHISSSAKRLLEKFQK